MNGIDVEGRIKASIHIGGVWASARPSVVRTVLGSCISVCLRDPFAKVGGMNHFMLPSTTGDDEFSARYGVNAMEVLINRCMQEGAERSRFEAKVFGGGHVLRTANHDQSVPRKNISFAKRFLEMEGIPVVSSDIGGYAARSVLFFTDSGRVLMKRLTETGGDAARIAHIRQDEAQAEKAAATETHDSGDITLF